jgi:hypothetical protein
MAKKFDHVAWNDVKNAMKTIMHVYLEENGSDAESREAAIASALSLLYTEGLAVTSSITDELARQAQVWCTKEISPADDEEKDELDLPEYDLLIKTISKMIDEEQGEAVKGSLKRLKKMAVSHKAAATEHLRQNPGDDKKVNNTKWKAKGTPISIEVIQNLLLPHQTKKRKVILVTEDDEATSTPKDSEIRALIEDKATRYGKLSRDCTIHEVLFWILDVHRVLRDYEKDKWSKFLLAKMASKIYDALPPEVRKEGLKGDARNNAWVSLQVILDNYNMHDKASACSEAEEALKKEKELMIMCRKAREIVILKSMINSNNLQQWQEPWGPEDNVTLKTMLLRSLPVNDPRRSLLQYDKCDGDLQEVCRRVNNVQPASLTPDQRDSSLLQVHNMDMNRNQKNGSAPVQAGYFSEQNRPQSTYIQGNQNPNPWNAPPSVQFPFMGRGKGQHKFPYERSKGGKGRGKGNAGQQWQTQPQQQWQTQPQQWQAQPQPQWQAQPQPQWQAQPQPQWQAQPQQQQQWQSQPQQQQQQPVQHMPSPMLKDMQSWFPDGNIPSGTQFAKRMKHLYNLELKPLKQQQMSGQNQTPQEQFEQA